MGARQSRFQAWSKIILPDAVDGMVQRKSRKVHYRCRAVSRYTNLDNLDRMDEYNSENVAQVEVGIDLAMYFDTFNQLALYGMQRNRILFPINETDDEDSLK